MVDVFAAVVRRRPAFLLGVLALAAALGAGGQLIPPGAAWWVLVASTFLVVLAFMVLYALAMRRDRVAGLLFFAASWTVMIVATYLSIMVGDLVEGEPQPDAGWMAGLAVVALVGTWGIAFRLAHVTAVAPAPR